MKKKRELTQLQMYRYSCKKLPFVSLARPVRVRLTLCADNGPVCWIYIDEVDFCFEINGREFAAYPGTLTRDGTLLEIDSQIPVTRTGLLRIIMRYRVGQKWNVRIGNVAVVTANPNELMEDSGNVPFLSLYDRSL